VKNPVVGGRNLDFYRYDAATSRARARIAGCMASVKIEDVFAIVTELI